MKTSRRLVRWLIVVAGMILLLLVLRGTKPTVVDKVVTPPLNQSAYRLADGWPDLSAELHIEGGSGVAIDSQGAVWMLHRAGHAFNNTQIISEPVILKLDPKTGETLADWGQNMFKSPHGLAIDQEDNIWVTDIMLNQVFKFSPAGKLLLSIGEPYYRGLETCLQIRNELTNLPCLTSPYHFARPTDITVLPNGRIYVTDGYRNARVAVFDAGGTFLFEWGGLGSEPGALFLPHGIANDAQGNIYVADRKNARIQAWNAEGVLQAVGQAAELGRPFGIDVDSAGFIYVIDGGDTLDTATSQGRSQIVKVDHTGKLVERWGWYAQESETIHIGHDIAVAADGSIYVVRLSGPVIQKFVPSQQVKK